MFEHMPSYLLATKGKPIVLRYISTMSAAFGISSWSSARTRRSIWMGSRIGSSLLSLLRVNLLRPFLYKLSS